MSVETPLIDCVFLLVILEDLILTKAKQVVEDAGSDKTRLGLASRSAEPGKPFARMRESALARAIEGTSGLRYTRDSRGSDRSSPDGQPR